MNEERNWLFTQLYPTDDSTVRFKRLLQRIAEASTYDPGEADLDDKQPAAAVMSKRKFLYYLGRIIALGGCCKSGRTIYKTSAWTCGMQIVIANAVRSGQ